MSDQRLTHQDEHGRAGMVSVSQKPVMRRRAVVAGHDRGLGGAEMRNCG